MVFILKVNNIQEKTFEPHCLRAPVQFLINTVQQRGNTNSESKIMQISQIMKNRDWLINFHRNIHQNQSGAYIGQPFSQGSLLPALRSERERPWKTLVTWLQNKIISFHIFLSGLFMTFVTPQNVIIAAKCNINAKCNKNRRKM